MINESIEPEALEALAAKIVAYANDADEKIIAAAMLVRQVRKRVESEETGDVTWTDWAREHIDLSPSRLRELMRIAEADDPKAELERLREQNAVRQARHREKQKKTQPAPLRNGVTTVGQKPGVEAGRQRLIDWAGMAPPEQVSEVLRYIDQLDLPAPEAQAAACAV